MSARRAMIVLAACALAQLAGAALAQERVRVASKSFTESVILGEIARLLLEAEGFTAGHERGLGGTRLVFNALESGSVDAYPDYTGTIVNEILASEGPEDYAAAREILRERGLRVTAPLGFNNTYAIGVLPETAERLGLETISDLRDHPGLELAFNNEFLERADGWPSLRSTYRLPQTGVRGLEHDLAYRAIAAGQTDAMVVYTTDAEIAELGLVLLEDDLEHFPTYEAVVVYRAELSERAPRAAAALRSLAGTLDEARMSALNRRVKIDGEPEAVVAADFVRETFGVDSAVAVASRFDRVLLRTWEHLYLVAIPMGAGVVVSLPLGIAAARTRRTGQGILAAVGILQTIPSLALLVFMIRPLGIGAAPAIAALFLYSLLPMVRATATGIAGIAPGVEESAEALGLSWWTKLLRIELPLAAPSVLSGVKTATVILIGFATLGGFIGAGGYGDPILTGIRKDDLGLMLEGAIPAAAMAIAAQGLFELLERLVVPRGLRLRRPE